MFEPRLDIITTYPKTSTMEDDSDEEMDDSCFDHDEDNDSNNFVDPAPFPEYCENELVGIESMNRCFERRYDTCPAFFPGSLREACEAAFSSIIMKERRPLLIYIHHDKSFSSNIFCSKIFCSTIITDYLLENYIVWPWDITYQSNEKMLIQFWEQIFPFEFYDDFSVKECPKLNGIMRLFQEEKDGLVTSEYQVKSLLEGDTLTQNQSKVTREMLLSELLNFKEEFYENEQALSLDFITKTGLCWDVILEITRYLTLNDAINAFSTNILPLLHKYKTKVHLKEPSDTFIKTILRKLNPEQIVSLQFNAEHHWENTESNLLTTLSNVTSISLLNYYNIYEIFTNGITFPQLTSLSIRYDNIIDFSRITNMISHLSNRVKRLKIFGTGTFCTHINRYQLNTDYATNFNIEYLTINMIHFPFLSSAFCDQQCSSCLLMIVIDAIKSMYNLQHVCLMTNKHNFEQLLYVNVWGRLADLSRLLKKITLRVFGNAVISDEISSKLLEIRTLFQPRVKFQVIYY